MEKIIIGIGSNIGDKEGNIRKAILLLSEILNNIKVAPIYISKAVGYENQPNFLNTVISGFTELPPNDLLNKVKEIEEKIGRRNRFRWGPREIDIDILFYGDIIIKTESLEIPHPRIHERDFVIIPLIDIEPNIIHPIFKKPLKNLLKDIRNKSILGKYTSYPH